MCHCSNSSPGSRSEAQLCKAAQAPCRRTLQDKFPTQPCSDFNPTLSLSSQPYSTERRVAYLPGIKHLGKWDEMENKIEQRKQCRVGFNHKWQEIKASPAQQIVSSVFSLICIHAIIFLLTFLCSLHRQMCIAFVFPSV